MRTLIILLSVLFGLNLSAQKMSEIEVKMFGEINKLRVDPASYVVNVEAYIKKQELILKYTSNASVKNRIVEAKKLIKVLESTKSMKPLTFSEPMYPFSLEHAKFIDSMKECSHKGITGKMAAERMNSLDYKVITENLIKCDGSVEEVIVELLVDAGNPTLAHRNNLLNPKTKYLSIANSGNYWVQNFAR